MDETDRRVDDVQIIDAQLREGVDDVHEVNLQDRPASTEGINGETIRPRGLVRRHIVDGQEDLILREG